MLGIISPRRLCRLRHPASLARRDAGLVHTCQRLWDSVLNTLTDPLDTAVKPRYDK